MLARLGLLLAALVLVGTTSAVVPAVATAPAPRSAVPSWAADLPAGTTQVVRTVSSRKYCRKVWCTVTQAWERDDDGAWTKLREFRSSIGSRGWGKQREGDGRSPVGVYRIKVTFTTSRANPGLMPWRQRRATSIVSERAGRNYNTWLEVRGVTSGNRPSMRSGWVLDFNRVRLRPGVGPRPVPGKGSGIFYHTSKPGHAWAPTAGCTQVGRPSQMRWLLTWLRPEAHPRVVQDR
ncbi:L,D-transpeptidase family protein [Nocardioides conyzicola]|uniref:L,D-TPase catalytic domain-containing protein n=1 Tax=Nocardioides conyzicola TaxID=1651781 RepID=A0ABP8WHH5_9ACTN